MDKGKDRRKLWGRLEFFPTNFFCKKPSQSTVFCENTLQMKQFFANVCICPFFYNDCFDITGPNQIYNNSTGPVLKVCKVGSLMRQEKLSVC